MGDCDDILASETAEHMFSAHPLAVSPPLSKPRRNRSDAWNHFTIDSEIAKKAKCNYCGSLIGYDKGTSAMRAHFTRCKDNPMKNVNKRQKSVSASTENVEEHICTSPSTPMFDQEAIQNVVVKMFVALDIPFERVEHAAFQNFMSVVLPRFKVPSSTELAHDVLRLWGTEKTRLKKFLSQHCQRVCLTIDTWTSSEKFCYMCLTAHFIDKDWKMHKKVLNFSQVTSHKREVMAKTVEQCLNEWGLNCVLSLTINNDSLNDVDILHLKDKLVSRNSLVLNGDFIHMRCCAYFLNLIVKESLKEIDDSVVRICAAVWYIRSSNSRFSRFKACAEQQNIEYKGFACLDFETRWDSIYLMLEDALKHHKTFEKLEMKDHKYVDELKKGKGVPTIEDWEIVRSILPFLKLFYDATLRICSSSCVTSNMYMFEVLGIGMAIKNMCNSGDVRISLMAKNMRQKYDKFWGNANSLNMLLLVGLVLDPRHKVKFVNWCACKNYNGEEADYLIDKFKSCLNSLFEEYNGGLEVSHTKSKEGGYNDPYGFNKFYQSSGCKKSETELSKYLDEALESGGDLDVLNWWKLNSSRFPIIANIARDVLAIPVSTMTPEFALSIAGRVLDSYQSSLPPITMEALICTQDWLMGAASPLLTNVEIENLEKIEQELISSHDDDE
ncbi:unnamed protein product [Trifolium pratense]|uniref:Uncharacterized protein n=1 Tax=Trifolium pratense TaxID=57577 RepID=A0ACB0LPK0_TRIPR|nr:unnamed protein product [Trifolium pratense]